MKLEFADKGTFSYWIQGFYAGCVHPDEQTEAVARAAWNAAIVEAARAIETMNITEPVLFARGQWNAAAVTCALAAKLAETLHSQFNTREEK